jgi:hypothetical protein
VDDGFVTRTEKAVRRNFPQGWRDFLDTPVTEEELKTAMRKVAGNKAPGRDGICLEFFKVNWESIKDHMLAIFNQMYLNARLMEQQTHDIIVCMSKTDSPLTQADYRPITWLNTNYKILARIITNRLNPTLSDMLHPSQQCGVPDNKVFDVVMSVRDAILYSELTHAPCCILCLEFTAFHRILHTYLFR